jgi:hypothetical protein
VYRKINQPAVKKIYAAKMSGNDFIESVVLKGPDGDKRGTHGGKYAGRAVFSEYSITGLIGRQKTLLPEKVVYLKMFSGHQKCSFAAYF